MDQKPEKLPPSIDFSNNFSGVPMTPPVSTASLERPLFSIGVDPPQKPTVVDTMVSSGRPPVTNLQDVGGAHLTVEKNSGMNRSASSPALSQFFSFIPGSKAINNVNIQVNVPSYSAHNNTSKAHDSGSSVDPEVKLPRRGSSGMLIPQEPPTKHIRKEMQTLYSGGEVNKYGSLFRKPGTDHKVLSVKKTEAIPPVAPLTPFKEEEGIQTPHVSLGHRFKKWITTSPVKHTDREKNAFSPTSF